MGLFAKRTWAAHFGELHGEGQSGVWEAQIDMGPLGPGFLVRVHGGKQGPTAAQCEAFGALRAHAARLRDSAVQPVADFLIACEVWPLDKAHDPEQVWRSLTPCFIEVHAGHEYPAGEGPPGSIAISVGYALAEEHGHLLQLGVIHGVLDKVYSE